MSKILIVGGPPGVGKSVFIKNIIKEDYKIYDLDSYRLDYPNYINLIKDKPVSANKSAAKYAGNLMHEDIANSLKNNEDFILECTFSSFDNTLEDIIRKQYKADIKVYLIITSFEEALISIYERYIKSFNELGYGRIVDIIGLKKKYDFFKNYIKRIINYNIDVQLFYRESNNYIKININDIDSIINNSNNLNSRLQRIQEYINIINNEELQAEFIKVKNYFKHGGSYR